MNTILLRLWRQHNMFGYIKVICESDWFWLIWILILMAGVIYEYRSRKK